MRVAVDFRVITSEAALRGMGRYTQQQVFEALRADPGLEVFPLLHGKLDPANCLHDWFGMPRVHPVVLDSPGDTQEFGARLRYAERVQKTLQHLGADVFHDATPFMDPVRTATTACPVVCTFYDAIPLIFPADYFRDQQARETYYAALANVRAADHVLAISRSAAEDLRVYTGRAADGISVAYPVVEQVFRSPDLAAADAASARRAAAASLRVSLPERFVLSVTGFHRSKNVGLLRKALDLVRRRADWPGLPVVMVLPNPWARQAYIERFGSDPDVITLCDVSDLDLRRLYASATLVFQPSLYEGFGYPVAEAMACGAPVIATTASSIPEVAGDAAVLVSPTDPAAAAEAMLALARDPDRRRRLGLAGRRQVERFCDPARLGEATVAGYRAAARNVANRPRVAVWSSMPPLDCGVADYTAELVDGLAETHDVDVYTDGSYRPTARRSPAVRFRDTRDFEPRQAGLIGRFFQLGARNYQSFMYPELRRWGGDVVVHDVSMGLGFFYLAHAGSRLDAFADEILAPEGRAAFQEVMGLLSRHGVGDRDALEALFDRHRLLRWVVRAADRLLVHTETLAEDVRQRYPEAEVGRVRMGVADRLPLARHAPLAAWRRRLGVAPDALVVGSFGIVDRVKRLPIVLRAFAALQAERPDSLLLIVGRTYDPGHERELHAAIAASPAAGRVRMMDYAPPEVFHALLALTDVVVNLRWPTRGGLSAVLVRALAAGKPVIVSDIADWRGIGGGACLPVTAGPDEAATIAGLLRELAADPARRNALGAAARAWFLRDGTVAAMVSDYLARGRRACLHRTPETVSDRI